MIKKERAIAVGVALIIITALLTVTVLSVFEIPIGHKVYVSEMEYQQMKSFEKEFGMLPSLKVFLEDNYYQQLDDEAMRLSLYKGLFEGAGDPYTRYLSKEEYQLLQQGSAGSFGGVGISMSVGEDGYVTVVSLTEEGPAYKAGILPGDVIIEVDGQDSRDLSAEEVSALVKGQVGTAVSLVILREGEMLRYTMERETIEETSAYGQVTEDHMGYIRLASFDMNTAQQFREALTQMEEAGVEGLVIDLRANIGGIVDQSVEIADMLMDEGVVVYQEDGHGERVYYRTEDGRTPLDYVILVNGATASASEVLVAGVQDNEEGVILGTQTYGKGIMQKTWGLKNGDGIEITFAQYYSPSGKVIHGVGITPDVVVELEESDVEGNYIVNDRQLEEAVKLLKDRARE